MGCGIVGAMSVSESFRNFVADQLEGAVRLTVRRMFGAAGLYDEDTFFGIIDNDTLYFKTDERTRARYLAAGMPAFNPYPDRAGAMRYHQVPLSVLEDAEQLALWAREAVQAARRIRSAGSPRRRPTAGTGGRTRTQTARARRRSG
jgi:DNA transformation protein